MKVRRAALVLASALLLGACGSGGSTAPPAPLRATSTGCVSQQQARQIWTAIDQRLLALERDPGSRGASAVATGVALSEIDQYLQQNLEQKHLTEREVDRLLDLSVLRAGCDGGALEVRSTELVVQDEYFGPDGRLDHRDPVSGTEQVLLETFVRSGGDWKESDFQDLTEPAASPTPLTV